MVSAGSKSAMSPDHRVLHSPSNACSHCRPIALMCRLGGSLLQTGRLEVVPDGSGRGLPHCRQPQAQVGSGPKPISCWASGSSFSDSVLSRNASIAGSLSARA